MTMMTLITTSSRPRQVSNFISAYFETLKINFYVADGGYGWVIVIASFLCNMVVDGIAYTFGVFLDDFAKSFGETKGTVTWVGSLLSGMYLTAGRVLANTYRVQ